MADVSSIVGIILMVIGGLLSMTGLVLCYTTKGEYYNAEEVQAMVAAEVLEEERKKREENEAAEAAIRESMDGAVAGEGDFGASANGLGDDVDAEMGAKTRKKRRGPLIAS